MFNISFSEFIKHPLHDEFKLSLMPGMTLRYAISNSVKVMLNIDSKVAFIYCD